MNKMLTYLKFSGALMILLIGTLGLASNVNTAPISSCSCEFVILDKNFNTCFTAANDFDGEFTLESLAQEIRSGTTALEQCTEAEGTKLSGQELSEALDLHNDLQIIDDPSIPFEPIAGVNTAPDYCQSDGDETFFIADRWILLKEETNPEDSLWYNIEIDRCISIVGSTSGGGNAGRVVSLPNPLAEVGADNPTLQVLVGRLITQALTLMGSLALVAFIIGGLMWLTSAGNQDRVRAGSQTMLWAAIGIFIILAAYAILNTLIGTITQV